MVVMKFRQLIAVYRLKTILLHKDTQTNTKHTTESATQTSFPQTMSATPLLFCLPVETNSVPVATAGIDSCTSLILKRNDDLIKFYTGLSSWELFDHLICFITAASCGKTMLQRKSANTRQVASYTYEVKT